MQVKRIVKNQDGNVDVSLMLTPEQASFFMQLGMNMLVARGGATIIDYTEEEFRAEQAQQEAELCKAATDAKPDTTVTSEQAEAEADMEFLKEVDKDSLPQA